MFPKNPIIHVALVAISFQLTVAGAEESVRVAYNHPGLITDLGVGLWAQPFAVDYDNDGDNDLLVATADKPYNGIYFFENPGGDPNNVVFKPGKRLDGAMHNITISHTASGWTLMNEGKVFTDFVNSGFKNPELLAVDAPGDLGKTRAKQWYQYDYDGDGLDDVIMGYGIWETYGWDDAWDDAGNWKNGPLRSRIFVARNHGKGFDKPVALLDAMGNPLETYGAPSPNFADWDGDGDDDLICGEFLDRLKYFENTGTRAKPVWTSGRFIEVDGETLHLDLQMLQVTSIDWDQDGDRDVIVGKEDGRVVYLECTGAVKNGLPEFKAPRYFQQESDSLKVGALSTPYGVDWDNDGDDDLIVGDTAGYISFVENLDGGNPPRWAEPVYLEADGETIRIQAGPNGSIQGPAEAKWGYTVLNVADWNHDGLNDIVINSIWGKIEWFENVGSKGKPTLAAAKPIEVAWPGETPKPKWNWWNPEGDALVAQWRTTPLIYDFNGDDLQELIMLDLEGYLSVFLRAKRDGKVVLLPSERVITDVKGEPLRLNERDAGGSGRRKLALADWDGDGKVDLLANSKSTDLYRNVSTTEGEWRFKHEGRIDDRLLAGHTTCPTTVDWNKNGVPDLLVGGEDGFFYYLENPRKP